MPYIKKEDKKRLDLKINHNSIKCAGQLNYAITMLCLKYLGDIGECYQTYNDIVGALECAKQELYRRKIAAYEQTKIEENGDVY